MGCFGIDLENDLIFDGVDRIHMNNVTNTLLIRFIEFNINFFSVVFISVGCKECGFGFGRRRGKRVHL